MPTFSHITWQDLFLSEPSKHINALATIENGGASARYYKVIGAAKIKPGDNRIYFDVFGVAGNRIVPIYIEWNWENSGITPAPGVGDKLPSEPSGGIDQIDARIWLEVQGQPSERITIPRPDGSSWYVVFRMVDISEPQPEPEPIPEPIPPSGQPPAAPTNLQVVSVTDTTVTLTWSVADQLAERFKVSWSKDMATWQQLTAQSMQATVPNLLPDTTYVFHVRAINQYGESPPAEIPGKTAPAPIGPPEPIPGELPRVIANSRNVVAPKHHLVIPPVADVLTPDYIHVEEDSYIILMFSLPELKRLVAYMESKGDEFIELGIELIPRQEYDSGNS